MINQKYLKTILDYIPETGWFIWKSVKPRSCVKVGDRAGCIHPKGYRLIRINKRGYRAGRLAFLWMIDRWPDPEVDHRNRIKDDDRWENLRDADRILQNSNRNTRVSPKTKKSKLPIGVCRSGKKFSAGAFIGNKRYHLGQYETPKDAHQAYLTFIREL